MKALFKNIFTQDKSFYKSLAALSLPLALGYLLTFSTTLTDSICVGRLGEGAVSGVYVGGTVNSTLMMISTGIEGGIQASVSQLWGKGDRPSIKGVFKIGAAVALTVGMASALVSMRSPELFVKLLLRKSEGEKYALEYLPTLAVSFPLLCLSGSISALFRSVEAPGVGMAAASVSFAANLVFDILLIFGGLGFPALGVRGAAISTVIAKALELSVLSVCLIKSKRLRARERKAIDLKKSLKVFFKSASPIMMGQLIWITNTLFAPFLLSKLDTGGTIAALAVANTLGSLSYVLMNGLSAGLGVLIGKLVGEGSLSAIRKYTYTSEAIFITVGALTAGALFIFASPFVSLYRVSPEAADIAKSFIYVLAVTVVGNAYCYGCLTGLMRGGGDVSFTAKNDAFFIFLLVIPLSLAAARLGAPLWLVFLALKSDLILKCIPAAVKIHRFRWIKDITKTTER